MIESVRGCGSRKVHCLYLCGKGIGRFCDGLDKELKPCPTCGKVPLFNRGISQIDPYSLFGDHGPECQCPEDCPLCHPKPQQDFTSFLMWVGDKYYTQESFLLEVVEQGVSKKIKAIPKGMILGESWVYLAKQGIIDKIVGGHPDKKKRKKADGIFSAFIPERVEYLITQSESENAVYVDYLKKQGLTVIVVPDDDPDHVGTKATKKPPADDRTTLDTFTTIDPHTETASTSNEPEYLTQAIDIPEELPQGITKWTEFIKLDLLKGLSMSEKATLWRIYKDQPEGSLTNLADQLFEKLEEEEEKDKPVKKPLEDFL